MDPMLLPITRKPEIDILLVSRDGHIRLSEDFDNFVSLILHRSVFIRSVLD